MTLLLTQKQHELLLFIEGSERTPSFEEMKEALGLKSKSGVFRMVAALEERGYIERLPNRARCIRVLKTPKPLTPPALREIPDIKKFTTAQLLRELRVRGWKVAA